MLRLMWRTQKQICKKKPELEKEEQLEYVENKSIGLLRETKVVEHELLKLLQNILLNV